MSTTERPAPPMAADERSTLDGWLDFYRAEVDAARARCADVALDDTRPFAGTRVSLRWIYAHRIAEYARHCGHADLVRERIDGATGV